MEGTLENEIGWDAIQDGNKVIGDALGIQPNVDWSICKLDASGKVDSIAFSPAHVCDWTPYQQKMECEKFMEEQRRKFPNGWIVSEGFDTTKREIYPRFDMDWNPLMAAVAILKERGRDVSMTIIMPDLWKQVLAHCKEIIG